MCRSCGAHYSVHDIDILRIYARGTKASLRAKPLPHGDERVKRNSWVSISILEELFIHTIRALSVGDGGRKSSSSLSCAHAHPTD